MPMPKEYGVVTLKQRHSKSADFSTPPLFFIHSITGTVEEYRDLANSNPEIENRLVYGIELPNQEVLLSKNITTLEQLAAYYVEIIKQKQECGPYYLAGWSLGGKLAVAIAKQLILLKENIAFLGVIDTTAVMLSKSKANMISSYLNIMNEIAKSKKCTLVLPTFANSSTEEVESFCIKQNYSVEEIFNSLQLQIPATSNFAEIQTLFKNVTYLFRLSMTYEPNLENKHSLRADEIINCKMTEFIAQNSFSKCQHGWLNIANNKSEEVIISNTDHFSILNSSVFINKFNEALDQAYLVLLKKAYISLCRRLFGFNSAQEAAITSATDIAGLIASGPSTPITTPSITFPLVFGTLNMQTTTNVQTTSIAPQEKKLTQSNDVSPPSPRNDSPTHTRLRMLISTLFKV